MDKKHKYSLTVKWTGNRGPGTSSYKVYDRSHSIIAANKPEIFCSSEPVFLGDKTKYNPEELFVASISSCHMLWYLHLCANSGIVVVDYVDNPVGYMLENPDGSGHFTEVVLYPAVIVKDKSMLEKADVLHEKAHQLCFIANSCNFKVSHKPSYSIFPGK
jgi:organic hydroperoxide reductase OsmC/OhrA